MNWTILEIWVLQIVTFFSFSFLGFLANFCIGQAKHALLKGTLIVVVFTAISVSNFDTIFVPILCLVLLHLWYQRRNKTFTAKGISWECFKQELAVSGLFLVIAGIHFFLLLFEYPFLIPKEQFRDYHFWAELSDFLLSTGIESGDYFKNGLAENKRPALYHYSDLWLNGLVSNVNGQPAILNLFGVTYPIFTTIVLITFYNCLLLLFTSSLKRILASILLLFFGGYFFEFQQENVIKPGFDFFQSQGLLHYHNYKLLIGYVGVIFVVYYLMKKDNALLFLTTSILVLIYPTFLFAALPVLGYSVWQIFKKESRLLWFFLPAVFFIFCYLFYLYVPIQPGKKASAMDIPDLSAKSFLNASRLTFDKVSQVLFFYVLVLIFGFQKSIFKQQNIVYFLIFICAFFFALIFSVLFHAHYDFWQFFTNPVYPLLNVVGLWLILVAIKRGRLKFQSVKIAALLLVYFVFFIRFDKSRQVYFEKNKTGFSYYKTVTETPALQNVLVFTKRDFNPFNPDYAYSWVGKLMFLNPHFKQGYFISLNTNAEVVPSIDRKFWVDSSAVLDRYKELINTCQIDHIIIDQELKEIETVFTDGFKLLNHARNGELLFRKLDKNE